MNITLIFPPQWSPTQPYTSLPSLVAYLKSKGYSVNQRDLNIESYNIFLSPEYLSKIYEYVLSRWKYLDSNDILLSKHQKEYYELFKATFIGPDIISQIDEAKALFRNPESFYNLELYSDAIDTLRKGLEMVSTAYYPTKITLSDFEMNPSLLSEADLLAAIENERENPFISIYKDYFLDDILNEPPDILGISIIGISQIMPGLTLARLVKSHCPEVHINIGGSIFTRLRDKIKGWSQIFGKIFDSIILYEGETPFLELCRCLSKGRDLASVPNLVYKNGESIVVNKLCKPERIDLLPTLCFDGLPLDMYLSPHPVLPILSSRGCYWGRCAFCDHGEIYGGRYNRRSTNLLMEDLRTLSNKHSTKFFTFNDEAIAPNNLKDISNAIISEKLEVKFNADLRLESRFTPDLFQLAFRAGFLSFYFGLESGHDRVLAHMCKGIDSQMAKAVFQNSSDAGIWNHAFLFFGFPTETETEARSTMDFVLSNKDIIHSVGHSTFLLGCCSRVMNYPEMFGVTSICEDKHSILDLWSSYSVSTGLTHKQAVDMEDEFQKRVDEEYSNLSTGGKLQREHLLLYLANYKSRSMLPFLKERSYLNALQVELDVPINETNIPQLKQGVLCGAARFDIAKILSDKIENGNALLADHFVILCDLKTGKNISITPSAAVILSYCDGKHTLAEVANKIAEKYNITRGKAITDCKKLIESITKFGLCNCSVQKV